MATDTAMAMVTDTVTATDTAATTTIPLTDMDMVTMGIMDMVTTNLLCLLDSENDEKRETHLSLKAEANTVMLKRTIYLREETTKRYPKFDEKIHS
ncbi:unnamed protein product, partial [Larinioides sclopetarius]